MAGDICAYNSQVVVRRQVCRIRRVGRDLLHVFIGQWSPSLREINVRCRLSTVRDWDKSYQSKPKHIGICIYIYTLNVSLGTHADIGDQFRRWTWINRILHPLCRIACGGMVFSRPHYSYCHSARFLCVLLKYVVDRDL